MAEKSTVIDFSEDRLLSMASDYLDDHNYIGALKMLNKNAIVNGNDDASFMLYAEIFDDLRLYEKSVNNWYKYLDTGATDDLQDAYESMAISYINMGNERTSAYYYNKLLIEAGEFSKETRQDLINSFIGENKPTLKFAYPPKLADYTEEITNGVRCMRRGDFNGAIECFDKVAEGNEKYITARNYIAMCKIICDKCEEAEAECKNVLEKQPENVQALTTLAAVKIQQRQINDARVLAKKLLTIPTEEVEDIYKIATVCCENGMHEEAFELFCKIEQNVGYDLSLLYFKGISAYNCHRLQDCIDAFDTLLAIYPNAVTARYYYEFIRKDCKRDEDQRETLSYFYRLPAEVRNAYLDLLGTVAKASKKKAREIADKIDLAECLYWCFEEPDESGVVDFVKIGAVCAEKIGLDFYVREVLLNAFLPDDMKLDLLTDLYNRNKADEFGVVLCHVYKNVKVVPVKLPRAKSKNFIFAYAHVATRFGIIDENFIYKLNSATQRAYEIYAQKEMLEQSKDVGVLMAIIYKISGIDVEGVTKDNFFACFDADEQEYDRITGELGL